MVRTRMCLLSSGQVVGGSSSSGGVSGGVSTGVPEPEDGVDVRFTGSLDR